LDFHKNSEKPLWLSISVNYSYSSAIDISRISTKKLPPFQTSTEAQLNPAGLINPAFSPSPVLLLVSDSPRPAASLRFGQPTNKQILPTPTRMLECSAI
jgi:hypothetical protein